MAPSAIGGLWRELSLLAARVDELENKVSGASLLPTSAAPDSTPRELSDPPITGNAVQVDAAPTGAKGGTFCKWCELAGDVQDAFEAGQRVVRYDALGGIRAGTVLRYVQSSVTGAQCVLVQLDHGGTWQGPESLVMRVPDEWKAG
jgi:hypothetical protein